MIEGRQIVRRDETRDRGSMGRDDIVLRFDEFAMEKAGSYRIGSSDA